MFNSKYVAHYALAVGIIFVVASMSDKIKGFYETTSPEDELIRDYLLNDSPLYGNNRPKIWIHSKYEVNSRKWRDFHSRNTTDLNQPYIHMTIKSIVNQCGDDFNICLIDDESFSKLLPDWDINLPTVAEPMKSLLRELAMMKLLYVYGGMVLPNTFVCSENMKHLYEEMTDGNKPFVCEATNKSVNTIAGTQGRKYMPSTYIMGTKKNNPIIKECVAFIQELASFPHFTLKNEFIGAISHKCLDYIEKGHMRLVGGEYVGIKDAKGKPVMLEELLSDTHIRFSDDLLGIFIPGEDILKRNKYNWFSVMPAEQLFNSDIIIVKYLMDAVLNDSIVSSTPFKKCVVTI